jgi:two-component system nitrogen regulation response regulator NtrX
MAHILVVDDDDGVRACLRDALDDQGHDVSEAPDGAVALTHLLASPDPTVVLLDLMMPRRDGCQVLRAVGVTRTSRHGTATSP